MLGKYVVFHLLFCTNPEFQEIFKGVIFHEKKF
ncbi:MAG: hypothetical protein ACFWUL_04450 [Dialister sp.]|jgi:hypothetical protein